METSDNPANTETKLQRIAWLSEKDPQKQFNWLMHHFNEESLRECFHKLDKKKALGVDKVSKEQYQENLEENITSLVTRMKTMSYRPGPVREVLIPKEDGKMRPLGISNFEDKIIQAMTAQILEKIYEPIFIENSFGFRPGRSCHMAIKRLHHYLFQKEIETVIDVDLKNFFGTIDHQLLKEILEIKIKDKKFIRYIVRMFKAGVLSKDDLKVNDEGVPQGSICSPILSNIFAHYAIDIWIQKTVKPCCKGRIEIFRYADDSVICCEFDTDAQRIKEALIKRMHRFKLELNQDKTKLVTFSKRRHREGKQQGAFDFLGFTFYLGRSKRKVVIPKLKSRGKTMRNKLKKVNEWALRNRNRYKMMDIWKIFCLKLIGHLNYYGVSHNTKYVEIFMEKSVRILFKWLNRRSQKRSFTWERFQLFLKKWPLPKPCVMVKLF